MSRRVLLLAVAVAVLAGCTAEDAEPSTTSTTITTVVPATTTVASACDSSLWRHVYHPARLHVVRACLTVTGTITKIRHEPDGDLHVLLTPDPAYQWTLQPANMARQHGALVLEPVCVRPPTQADAKAACAGYRSPIKVPPIGTHVRATGAYVLDGEHDGWAELHPVTSITADGRTQAAAPTSTSGDAYYANCAAAQAAGTAPLHRGQQGYRPALDRDGDGVACE